MRHFVEDLDTLTTKLLEMSSLVESAIQRSISAVINKDKSAAEEVFRNEARINEIEIEIDEFATNLLALQQPMAADLRLIVAALKINTDLEILGPGKSEALAERLLESSDENSTRPRTTGHVSVLDREEWSCRNGCKRNPDGTGWHVWGNCPRDE